MEIMFLGHCVRSTQTFCSARFTLDYHERFSPVCVYIRKALACVTKGKCHMYKWEESYFGTGGNPGSLISNAAQLFRIAKEMHILHSALFNNGLTQFGIKGNA